MKQRNLEYQRNILEENPCFNYGLVKPLIFARIVSKSSKEIFLRHIPYMDFLDDFAIVASLVPDFSWDKPIQEEKMNMYTITKDLLKTWDLFEEEVFQDAVGNIRHHFKPIIRDFQEEVNENNGEMLELNNHIYILTNDKHFAGASMVLCNGILRDFAKTHGDFYIAMPTTDEALLIPVRTQDDKALKADIKKVVGMAMKNKADSEILNNKAYLFEANKGIASSVGIELL
jgi:hypothetical protein